MRILNWRTATGLAAAVALWSGCTEVITEVGFDEWAPELAAPLLDTRFSLRDALAGTEFAGRVSEDGTSALRIQIEQELFAMNAGDALAVPGFAVPLLDVSTTFDFDDAGIDLPVSRIDLTGVTLYYQFRNDYPLAATVTMETSNFLVAGQPVRHTMTVPAMSTAQDSVAVAGASFRAGEGNTITVTYDADLTGGAQDVRLTGGLFAVRAVDFAYAEGKLEDLSLDFGLDSVTLDLFADFEPGTVRLVKPEATLVIESSVGAPIRVRTTEAFARLRDGGRGDLLSPLTQGVTLNYPSLTEGAVSKRTELVFDGQTSNLYELLNGFPSAMAVGLNGTVNPEGRDETFALHRNATVRGSLAVNVPLAMEFKGFEVRKDFPLDGSSLVEASSVKFLLRVDNGFNLDALAQVEFFGADGASLGFLFPQPQRVLAAAVTRVDGSTVSSTAETIEIAISGAQLENLALATSAQVILSLTTPTGDKSNATFTQLYYDSEIGVKLGTKVTLKPR